MTLAPSVWELAARQFDKTNTRWESPLDLAQALDPRVQRSPDLDLINEKLVRAFNTPDSRLIISMPPQRGKSELCSHWFPVWALTQRPETRITLASYQANIARTFGRKVRDEFVEHGDVLGQKVRADVSSQNEWLLEGTNGGMFTAGVGGSLTSKPSDLMVIDDPVKGHAEANSPTYQEKTWSWWTGTALSRLATGARGAPVIMVLTRWSENDLAGKVMEHDPGEWDFVRIPAQADHDPDAGETDPLGREPGEWMRDVRGTTDAQWEKRKAQSGPYTWAALYQGKPAPPEGGVFPHTVPDYDTPMWTENVNGARTVPGVGARPDHELIQSWDLSVKDTPSADFTVGQVWLRISGNVYLLDQVRERMDFNAQVKAIEAMSAKWPQAAAKFVEDKANGSALISLLRGRIPGLIPLEPAGGKVERALAVSPFMYSRNVYLPKPALLPNVKDLHSEIVNFPNSAHDDTIDALTQALNQLLLNPITGHGNPLDEVDPGDWRDDY